MIWGMTPIEIAAPVIAAIVLIAGVFGFRYSMHRALKAAEEMRRSERLKQSETIKGAETPKDAENPEKAEPPKNAKPEEGSFKVTLVPKGPELVDAAAYAVELNDKTEMLRETLKKRTDAILRYLGTGDVVSSPGTVNQDPQVEEESEASSPPEQTKP